MRDLDIDPRIIASASKIGISELTEPQRLAYPVISRGKDLLLVAPTGIGKTEAAMLPILQALVQERPPKIAALYLTPLRSLNRDLLRRLKHFASELDLEIAVRHGDTPQSERSRLARQPPDILISTPETLQVLLTGRNLRKQLANLKWVIVDEVHELAGDERGIQLAVALERLRNITRSDFQRIGLSATIGSPQEVAKFLGGIARRVETVVVNPPRRMDIRVELPEPSEGDTLKAEELRAQPIHVACMGKLLEAVRGHRSTIVFVNTRDTAEFLASRLASMGGGMDVGVHHGSLSKEIRIQMEEDFKAGRLKGLVCTSSLELGIDVGSTDFVVQYGSPREVTRLIQRIGRSGHSVGEMPRGLILTTSEDDFLEAVVIARRARQKELEPITVRKNDLAVLANQIAAMASSEPGIPLDRVFETFRRAYPYEGLTRNRFDALVKQLSDLRVISVREGNLARSRATLTHFYENISMIPDVKTYRVVDITSRRTIGTLDEWFVAESAEVGETFVMKGTTWRFVELKEGEVLVEPVAEIGGVPSWIGEEIPVPFDVAQEVGRLRREMNLDDYPLGERGRSQILGYIKGQAPYSVPTDNLITVESSRGTIVVNCCFGTRANETLGQLLSSMLSARLGESVGVQTDPYRIVLEVPRSVDVSKIRDILTPEDPEGLEPLMRVILRNSNYLRWAFVHVAKKFGVLRRDVNWEDVNIGRLMKAFESTPLGEEVLDKILWERMDLERTKKVLADIKNGKIEFAFGGLSPMGRVGLGSRTRLITLRQADASTLAILKKRLEAETTLLVCLNCKSHHRSLVLSLPERIVCPICDAKMVAALRRRDAQIIQNLRTNTIPADERQGLRMNADLVRSHGRAAVMVLMARGVGPDTAARILRGYHETEQDLLRDILSAEVNYARTRRFWD